MKPRNARLLDDLLAGANSERLYRFVRDGRLGDLAEILAGLEQRMDTVEGREALMRFTALLLDCRPERGAGETRARDRLTKQLNGKSSRSSTMRDPSAA